MKRISFFLVLLVISITSYARAYEAKFSQPNNHEYQISFKVNEWVLQSIELDGVSYQHIKFDVSTLTDKKGWAELPFINAAIQLPAKKNVDLNIVYSDFTDYQLDFPLVPSRGVIYRNQNPADIPYIIDPASIVDAFYPEKLAIADEPYIIRDVRGTSVRVFPFQYNAVTNTLRVYNKIDVVLTENNELATNPLLVENLTPVIESIGMYQSLFLNYDVSRFDLPMAQHGELLVLTTERDAETIDTYIQWKKEKGITVHKEIVATGTNVKSLIKQKYDENNNIIYVQLIGDWADIKADLHQNKYPIDPMLGCVAGNDDYPDIAISRFSCSNANQLNVQINKSIEYEKNPDADDNWYESYIGIGSNEGNGIGDDGESDYLHIQRIYTQRLNPFTYNTHYQNYDPGANAATLTGHINAGASAIAYAGHGHQTGLSTTGYSNSHINQLTNGNKLPFFIACACNTGEYNRSGGDCFGEAWLNKENGGAIATLMSSISQAWAPPMRGQDYFFDMLIGGFDYNQYPGQNGINTNEQRTIWGSMVVNMYNLMLTEKPGTDLETVKTWISFGDVCFQLRTKQPDNLVSSMPTLLVGTPYTTTITANGEPVIDALVCISQNDVYLSALTDENGEVTIANDFIPGDILLVVTAFNTTTIYETIECIPAEGGYLIKDSFSLDGDGVLSFGETTDLNIVMKNVGQENLNTNSEVTISCFHPMITIHTNTLTYPPVNAGELITVTDNFVFSVSEDIENGQNFAISIDAANGDDNWQSKIYIKAYKPILEYVDMTWAGIFEPGETIQLSVSYQNIGGFYASNSIAALNSESQYVNIINPEYNFGTIDPTGLVTAIFNVEIDESTPSSEIIEFTTNIVADGNITAEGEFSIGNYCNIVFDLTDSYGDGWTGNKLKVEFSDGTPTKELTISYGASASYTLEVTAGTVVTVSFITGSYSYECSFKIYYEGMEDNPIYESYGAPMAGIVTEFATNCGGSLEVCDPITNLYIETDGIDIELSWDASEDVAQFLITRNGISIADITEKSYTDFEIVKGIYTYCVIAEYSEPYCLSLPECIVVYATECEAPTNLTVEAIDNSVILEWDDSDCADSYNVYVNGELFATDITDNSYTHINPSKDIDLYYSVTAVNMFGESEHSNEVHINYIGINMTNNNTKIYPNPTTGTITIECENINRIIIYSLAGNIVYQANVNSDVYEADLSHLTRGAYFVKIINTEGVIVKKIIKQ